jgi:hypothetical protein
MSEAVIRGSMEIWRQFVQRMSHERRVGEAREGERVAEGVDGNGNGEDREVELIIGREVGGLEEEIERREDEGGRVWGRNQGSDEDEDEKIDEGRRGAEGGPGRDRGHDGEERMQFQKDRVREIVAISEMEADEKVGF